MCHTVVVLVVFLVIVVFSCLDRPRLPRQKTHLNLDIDERPCLLSDCCHVFFTFTTEFFFEIFPQQNNVSKIVWCQNLIWRFLSVLRICITFGEKKHQIFLSCCRRMKEIE